jgi:hypothetical protein
MHPLTLTSCHTHCQHCRHHAAQQTGHSQGNLLHHLLDPCPLSPAPSTPDHPPAPPVPLLPQPPLLPPHSTARVLCSLQYAPPQPAAPCLPPPAESKINYSELYFCNVAPRGAFLKFLFASFVLVLLPLLFCLLGDTTEFYFAPIMAQVSMSIPKMRPRFAGEQHAVACRAPAWPARAASVPVSPRWPWRQ